MSISTYFGLAKKLSKRYLKEYFIEYFKKFIFALLAWLLMFFVLFFASFSLVAINNILGIILFLISFIFMSILMYYIWKLFVINYALIEAVHEFIKNGAKKQFREIVQNVNEKELLKYITFYSFITLIPFLFIINILIILSKNAEISANIDFLFQSIIINFSSFLMFLILFILLIPFFAFGLQAYFYKKPQENYIDIFKNTYKMFDFETFTLVLIFLAITSAINVIPIINTLITMFILPPFTIIIYSFKYYSKIRQKKN